MPLMEKNNVKYYTFDLINKIDFINHCMSTKIGGVSTDEFSTMNLAFNRGDKDINVAKNYEIICDTVGFTYENIVLPMQVHGKNIITITKDMLVKNNKGEKFHQYDFGGSDGFVTAEKNICITAFSADCVPIFFADTEKKVVGIAHAGWRGTLNNIVEKMVSKMVNEFNCNPKNIISGIGPSINQCCFEVDFDVADEFKKNLIWADKFIMKKGSKYHIDLQLINKEHLLNTGLLEHNIEVSTMCTTCNSTIFFSHRKVGDKRGNQASLIEIRN